MLVLAHGRLRYMVLSQAPLYRGVVGPSCSGPSRYQRDFKDQEIETAKYLPSEIYCPKYEGPIEFERDTCKFCGAKLDKSAYYAGTRNQVLGVGDGEESESSVDEDRRSFTAQYALSVLIHLVGFIMGAIFLSKGDDERRDVGIVCIALVIASIFVGVLLQTLMTA